MNILQFKKQIFVLSLLFGPQDQNSLGMNFWKTEGQDSRPENLFVILNDWQIDWPSYFFRTSVSSHSELKSKKKQFGEVDIFCSLLNGPVLTPLNFRVCALRNVPAKCFNICHILYIQRPKVPFSVFHFMLLYTVTWSRST